MRARDLREVLSIEHVVFPRPWSIDLFRAELAAPDRSYLVAVRTTPGRRPTRMAGRRSSVIVGYGGIQTIVSEAHIVTLAAHPAWRRLGIGARLVLELLGESARRGAQAITLEVRESNTTARHLYERFGFVDEGARPGYYADNQEAARILWLRDLGAPASRATASQEAHRRGLTVPASLQP